MDANPHTSEPVPTLCEWAGGLPAFERLTAHFYARVPEDPLLAPVFAGMSADHPAHVARFLAEVLGGPRAYSGSAPDGGIGGSHAGMVERHQGRRLTEEQRRRWLTMLQESADAVGLPDDPEFRSAFVGYLEWGSRLAVINSCPGAVAPPPDSPMPRWDWGPVGGPYRPASEDAIK